MISSRLWSILDMLLVSGGDTRRVMFGSVACCNIREVEDGKFKVSANPAFGGGNDDTDLLRNAPRKVCPYNNEAINASLQVGARREMVEEVETFGLASSTTTRSSFSPVLDRDIRVHLPTTPAPKSTAHRATPSPSMLSQASICGTLKSE